MKLTYEEKLARIQKAAKKKEMRLIKRLQIAKGKPRRLTRVRLLKELQRITNKIVRLSYPHVCYTCGKDVTGDAQAGHLWTQAGHAYSRFDFDNLRIQGSCCNKYKSGYHSMFAYKLRKEIGDERYEALYSRAKSSQRFTTAELEQMIAERNEILANLEQN